MIQGTIEKRQAKIPIVVGGLRKETETEALIDTGFSGSISLPIEIAVELGLELFTTAVMELADGSFKRELIFKGNVKLGDEKKEIEILLNESDQTLLGTNLLSNKKLELDFIENKIILK